MVSVYNLVGCWFDEEVYTDRGCVITTSIIILSLASSNSMCGLMVLSPTSSGLLHGIGKVCLETDAAGEFA